MENYSLFMGAAVMKMAVEMAAVSMEKPSGALPRPAGAGTETLSPDLGFAMTAAWNFLVSWLPPREINHIATGTARASMENYSLFMGAAAVMKMAVEMAAVSMEKPSGVPRSGVPEQRLSPDLGFDDAAPELFSYRGFLVRVLGRDLYIGEEAASKVEEAARGRRGQP
ncbi:hypothetical protein QYE76_010904 [Lolium multiflorum]|uniref:Uncharacterized protein n=1 Tax=Lolium multiflorum TaxID=4521 RepID=A0AAD8TWF9_LOLMU|nr:hypothetical protein QYE76_010904 [Lolium multiflorum]